MLKYMVAITLAGAVVLGTAAADDQCGAALDEVRTRVETDYVGYAMAVAPQPPRLAAYRVHTERLRREAVAAAPAACTYVLRDFIQFFDDPHLFVLEDPQLTESESAAFRARAEHRAPPRGMRGGSRRGLSGAWASPEFDVQIVRDGARQNYVAIVTATRSAAWAVGDVAARFQRRNGEDFATLYRASDRAPLRYRAALQRDGQLLHGRRGADLVQGFNPANPRAPLFANLSMQASVLTIPSFAPEHEAALRSLLDSHRAEILGRDLLIIDLRGNEGGSSLLGRLLAPYYASAAMAPVAPPPYPMALASPRIIGYFATIRDGVPPGEERALYDDFVRRMEAAPGELVPFFEDRMFAAQVMAPQLPQQIYEAPAHVAIIVDHNSVSAAEAFVLEAGRSERVTIFGENTGGSIDYQNVAMFRFGDGSARRLLGLPTSAAFDDVTTRGFNAEGVPVDVDLTRERDWIGAVTRHFGVDSRF